MPSTGEGTFAAWWSDTITYGSGVIGLQVLTNLIAAAVAFSLAWWAFPRFALQTDSGVTARGTLPASKKLPRWFRVGRVWKNPFLWKEFYFICGGDLIAILKFLVLLALLPAVAVFHRSTSWNMTWMTVDDLLATHAIIMVVVIMAELAINASRVFQEEVQRQTLVSLLVLPRSIGHLAYSKVGGAMLGIIPALLCLGIDILFHSRGAQNTAEFVLSVEFWMAILVGVIFLHVTVLISLYVKWGALPLAFFVTLFSMYCCPVFFLPLMIMRGGSDEMLSFVLIPTLLIFAGFFLFVLQGLIHARLYELGTK
jgi:hypothetical protein